MYVFPALLPILAALVMMCGFKVSPGKAMPAAWLLSAGIALSLWQVPGTAVAAASLQGIFKSLDIICIIAGAVTPAGTEKLTV